MCPLEENPIILSSGGMALGNLPPTAAKRLLKKKKITQSSLVTTFDLVVQF